MRLNRSVFKCHDKLHPFGNRPTTQTGTAAVQFKHNDCKEFLMWFGTATCDSVWRWSATTRVGSFVPSSSASEAVTAKAYVEDLAKKKYDKLRPPRGVQPMAPKKSVEKRKRNERQSTQANSGVTDERSKRVKRTSHFSSFPGSFVCSRRFVRILLIF